MMGTASVPGDGGGVNSLPRRSDSNWIFLLAAFRSSLMMLEGRLSWVAHEAAVKALLDPGDAGGVRTFPW